MKNAMLAALALMLGGCVMSVKTVSPAALRAERAASLDVRLEGMTRPSGNVIVALYDDEDAFGEGEEPVRTANVPVVGASALVQFADLAAGGYAVRAWHDVNCDGAATVGEPVASSHPDRRAEGAGAGWEASRFDVRPGANSVAIALR